MPFRNRDESKMFLLLRCFNNANKVFLQVDICWASFETYSNNKKLRVAASAMTRFKRVSVACGNEKDPLVGVWSERSKVPTPIRRLIVFRKKGKNQGSGQAVVGIRGQSTVT